MLNTLKTIIEPEWIDYNGHLNDAYYLVIFTKATDNLQHHLGMTKTSIHNHGFTLYTVESHLMYQQEVGLGAAVSVTTQVLEHDNKRVRIFHRMFDDTGLLLASAELLLLSYHLLEKRVVNFDAAFATRLSALYEAHQAQPMPAVAGKGIVLKPKR